MFLPVILPAHFSPRLGFDSFVPLLRCWFPTQGLVMFIYISQGLALYNTKCNFPQGFLRGQELRELDSYINVHNLLKCLSYLISHVNDLCFSKKIPKHLNILTFRTFALVSRGQHLDDSRICLFLCIQRPLHDNHTQNNPRIVSLRNVKHRSPPPPALEAFFFTC